MTKDEKQAQDQLNALFENLGSMDDGDREAAIGRNLFGLAAARTFDEDGAVTRDAGLTLLLPDGSRFLIAILQLK